MEWAAQLPEGALRDQVFQFAMQRWAHRDLEAAAAWASSSGGETADRAVPAIAKAMAAQEPAKAADWVMQWEDSDIRLSTLQNLTQHWAAREPENAVSWAADLGKKHESASQALLARLADTDIRALYPDAFVRPTSRTIRDVDELLGQMALVRQRLWSEAREETFAGFGAFGAAFQSRDGGQAVAFSISYPINNVSSATLGILSDALLATARRAGGKIGDPWWLEKSAGRTLGGAAPGLG